MERCNIGQYRATAYIVVRRKAGCNAMLPHTKCSEFLWFSCQKLIKLNINSKKKKKKAIAKIKSNAS